jgi:hypothetical protein
MDQQEAYAHELMQERYRLACEALGRCAKAGAKPEDLNTLARECGINPKDITETKTNG